MSLKNPRADVHGLWFFFCLWIASNDSLQLAKVRTPIRRPTIPSRRPTTAARPKPVLPSPGRPTPKAPPQEPSLPAATKDTTAIEPVEPGRGAGRPIAVAGTAAPITRQKVKAPMALEPTIVAAIGPKAAITRPNEDGAGLRAASRLVALLVPLVRPSGHARGPVVLARRALAAVRTGLLEAPAAGPSGTVGLAGRPTVQAVQATQVEDGLVLVLEAASTVLVVRTALPQRVAILRRIGPIPRRNAFAGTTRLVGVLAVSASVAGARRLLPAANLLLSGPVAVQGEAVVAPTAVRLPTAPALSANSGHVVVLTQASATEGRPRLPAHVVAKPANDGLRLGGRRQRPLHARTRPRRLVALATVRHGQRRPSGQRLGPSGPRVAVATIMRPVPTTHLRRDTELTIAELPGSGASVVSTRSTAA